VPALEACDQETREEGPCEPAAGTAAGSPLRTAAFHSLVDFEWTPGSSGGSVVLDAVSRGWFRDDGGHFHNENTFKGTEDDGTELYRSYFVFELPPTIGVDGRADRSAPVERADAAPAVTRGLLPTTHAAGRGPPRGAAEEDG